MYFILALNAIPFLVYLQHKTYILAWQCGYINVYVHHARKMGLNPRSEQHVTETHHCFRQTPTHVSLFCIACKSVVMSEILIQMWATCYDVCITLLGLQPCVSGKTLWQFDFLAALFDCRAMVSIIRKDRALVSCWLGQICKFY